MTQSQSRDVQSFLKELRQWTGENIRHQRTHVQQISVLAGAIAAFLMPVYASQAIATFQRSLIAVSIVMLLLCILTGMLYLWQIIWSDAIDLEDIRISIEEKDKARKIKYDERKEKRLKRRDKPDIVNILIHVIFTGAIVLLVVSFVLGEYGV